MKRIIIALTLASSIMPMKAQYGYSEKKDTVKLQPLKNVQYLLEAQASLSGNKTPLWLNANKYGLSSLEKFNAYARAAVYRPIETDEARKWGIGYGLDIAITQGYTSRLVAQQAYAELRWLKGKLTVGAKEEPMMMKNTKLSTGAQTLGINARPIPQIRVALPDYWTLPVFNGWLHLKGHLAYGTMTDQNWQHDFTGKKSRYADNVLYHSKAGFLKISNEEVFCPWSLEMGLEMVTLFGGTGYVIQPNGKMQPMKGGTRPRDFINALLPGGSDAGETTYQNIAGDQLGSWMAKLKYDGDWHMVAIYADKFFEDQSSMFQLDYDGYGSGTEWTKKVKRRFLLYDFKDWQIGFEYNYKPDNWINDFVFEYLYTQYQSGPIYHDHTNTIADHIGGKDNFYNHYIYTGHQHWGQVMGNPLYRSPIYNTDGRILVANNRFEAFHIGLGGHPSEYLDWRFLATWQKGLGTYEEPYFDQHHNVSLLAEASYRFLGNRYRWLDGMSITVGAGADFGAILGGINYGMQITIAKRGLLKL